MTLAFINMNILWINLSHYPVIFHIFLVDAKLMKNFIIIICIWGSVVHYRSLWCDVKVKSLTDCVVESHVSRKGYSLDTPTHPEGSPQDSDGPQMLE